MADLNSLPLDCGRCPVWPTQPPPSALTAADLVRAVLAVGLVVALVAGRDAAAAGHAEELLGATGVSGPLRGCGGRVALSGGHAGLSCQERCCCLAGEESGLLPQPAPAHAGSRSAGVGGWGPAPLPRAPAVLTAVQLVKAVWAVVVPVAAPELESAGPVPALELVGLAGAGGACPGEEGRVSVPGLPRRAPSAGRAAGSPQSRSSLPSWQSRSPSHR